MKIWGLHERENPLHDGNHSSLCPRVPIHLPGKTCAYDPQSKIPSADCQGQMSASPQHWYHNTRKRQCFLGVGTRLADGETCAGWGAVARSPHGIDITFGPVITTEALLAFVHSDNTADMSDMAEAFPFGPHGLVARDANSCVCFDSKHAAGVCLGTIQARTNVQLGPANSYC